MSDPTRMSPAVDRISLPARGRDRRAPRHRQRWHRQGDLAPAAWAQRRRRTATSLSWTDDDVRATPNVARVNAGPESEKVARSDLDRGGGCP